MRKSKPTRKQRQPAAAPDENEFVERLLRVTEDLTTGRCQSSGRPIARHAVESSARVVDGTNHRLDDLISQINAFMAEDNLLTESAAALFDLGRTGPGQLALLRSLLPHITPAAQKTAKGSDVPTRRELEALSEASKGYSYDQIAWRLGIHRKTVDKHLQNVYRKLRRHSALQAAARAVDLGYLQFDVLDITIESSRAGSGRNVSQLLTLCTHGGDVDNSAERVGTRPLIEFALLLLVLSSLSARSLSSYEQALTKRGIVCEIGAGGKVLNRFGAEEMGVCRTIAVAPPHAVKEGFTPGNLFIGYDYSPQAGLNRVAIAEYTPDGAFVEAFSGATTLGCRLVGPVGIAFAPCGSMLVTSGLLTDAILRFRDGGRLVEPFAKGLFCQIATLGDTIIGAKLSAVGSQIVSLDSHGCEISPIGDLHPHHN